MENNMNKTFSIILPVTYRIKQIRRQSSFFNYLVFTVEVFFFLFFPLNLSINNSDDTLKTFINLYRQYIILNKISGLFFLFIIIFLIGLLTAKIKSQLGSSRYDQLWQKLQRFYLISFVVFQITIMAALIISVQNIINNTVPELNALSITILPIAFILIALQDERRLYQFSSIIIIFFRLFTSDLLTTVIIAVMSIRRARGQRKQLHKKIVYYQIGCWLIVILIVRIFQQQINYLYILVGLIAIAAFSIFNPLEEEFLSSIEENQKLISLVQKLSENKRLSIPQKIIINRCICSFQQDVLASQDIALNQQRQFFTNLRIDFQKEQLIHILFIKIDYELKKQYSHALKIQKLECETKFNKFCMKTLYNIEKLTEEVKLQSSFEEKEKLYDLICSIQKKFLQSKSNNNMRTIISVDKNTEELYQYLINIAIVMQQFWTLHKNSRLNSQIIYSIVTKIFQMENHAQQLMKKIKKFSNAVQEVIIFGYLKQMMDCSFQLKDQNIDKTKQDFGNKFNINYILIQQGAILEMSNRLLNQFQLTKQQAQGYYIGDILHQPISKYLTSRLDKLIEQELYQEQTNFILPLKVSRDSSYIQPYLASVKIIPELVNGIKYIMHLQKNAGLQKPMLLYQSQTDKFIGITKNFKQHFNISQDQYVFEYFCNELFNTDVVQVLEQDNSVDNIHCQFKIVKKGKKIQKDIKDYYVPVILNKIDTYVIDGNQLMLISLCLKDYVNLQNIHPEDNINFTSIKKMSEPKQRDHQQQFFCKIRNPYQNLIQQKLTKMNEFYRISYLKLFLLVIIILLAVIIIALSILSSQTIDFQTQLMENYYNSIEMNNKQINIYSLYKQSAMLYQLKTFPNHFYSVNPNYNISSMQTQYASKINASIGIIINQAIDNYIYQQQQTSFDLISYAKQFIASNNITSLITSWDAKQIKGVQTTNFQQIMSRFNFFFTYYLYSTVSSVGFILLMALLICYKLEGVFCQLISVFQSIDYNHSSQFVEKYRIFAHQLYCSKNFGGIKSNSYLKNYSNKHNFENIDQVGTIIYLQNTVGFEMEIDQSVTVNSRSPIKINKRLATAAVCKQLHIISIIIFVAIFLSSLCYFKNNYQKQLNQIENHSDILHDGIANISFSSSAFMVASLQQILPIAQRKIFAQPNVVYLSIQFDSPLPSFFNNYTLSENLMTNMNLCNLYLNSKEALFKPINCSSILDGILKVSVSQAIIRYNTIVSSYLSTNMSLFNDVSRNGAKYPAFFQILYSGKTLLNLLTSLEKIFTILAKVYIKISNKILIYIVKLGWILLPILMIICYIFYNRQSSKCQILLKLFFILPKEFLLQMKVTKMLKKRDILGYIQRLAF